MQCNHDMFEPFVWKHKVQAVTVVKEMFNDKSYSPHSNASLAALWELASDSLYRNLPISPASLLVFGDTSGGASAVTGHGTNTNMSGTVISVNDPSRFNHKEFGRAMDLFKRLQFFDQPKRSDTLVPVIAGFSEFEYLLRAPLRLCYIEGIRSRSEDLYTEMSVEIAIGLENMHSGVAERFGKGWLVISGYEQHAHVNTIVDKLMTNYRELFGKCMRQDNMVYLNYLNGHDWKTFRL